MASKKNDSEIEKLLNVVEILRSPEGCPWDKKQTHKSLRYQAVEEAYELIDAIEKNSDAELMEELGDLLLQVVLHSQIAKERKAFDFNEVCKNICEKLIRRHPHVFGDSKVDNVDSVWAQWERLKIAEKKGTPGERNSIFDGIPNYLPALMYAEKLLKKAKRAGIELEFIDDNDSYNKQQLARKLFSLVQTAHRKGWSAEALLRTEAKRFEKNLRKIEIDSSSTQGKQTGKTKKGCLKHKQS